MVAMWVDKWAVWSASPMDEKKAVTSAGKRAASSVARSAAWLVV